MNGPEHYREAERLLDEAKKPTTINLGSDLPSAEVKPSENLFIVDDGMHITDFRVAMAQAHATLALAAATVATKALGPQELWGGHSFEAGPEWAEVTS